jgi:hypothetical protein
MGAVRAGRNPAAARSDYNVEFFEKEAFMKTRSMSKYSRRQFISRCAACAGCAVSGVMTMPRLLNARQAEGEKPKIRLVFCETTNDKPIWPNIGYDFDSRRNQLIDTLTKGCPDLQFFPVQVMDRPEDADTVLASDSQVDGYIVLLQGLGWSNDIIKLTSTGKPTLLVDNLFGGSGMFLTRQPQIMSSGKPVDWVSSSNDQDIVDSARHFALLKAGKSAQEIVAAFRAIRRKNTPMETDWACKNDDVGTMNLDQALKRLSETTILVVGGGWGEDEFRVPAEKAFGVKMVSVPFEELAQAYKQADMDHAKNFADQWIKNAQQVVEPSHEDVCKSGMMYVAMKQLLDIHKAQGISINCLGGFYGGHLQAYPCLGFSQLNNDGMIGGCEGDQMSALTMAFMTALTGRASFISDPVIDTSKNEIVYAHCVAMTKPFGSAGTSNPYLIRSHSEDRKGACVQSLLPVDFVTSTLEIDPVSRKVIFHQAKTTGNCPSDLACRTKLRAVVKGDLEKLTENWAMGWHRVTVYGDLKEPVMELCDRLKFEMINEA